MTTSLIVNNNIFDIVKRERLQVNDYLGINDEKVKILGFDSENNALIVERRLTIYHRCWYNSCCRV